MIQEAEFQEIDRQIAQIRKVVDNDMQVINQDISEISKKFLNLFQEYERIASEASQDLNEGLEKIDEDKMLEGMVKIVKGLFKKGVSWWKKRKWFQNFQKQKNEIYNEHRAIIEKRLSNLRETQEKHIPFIRETVKRILLQIGSFNIENIKNESIKDKAIDRAEEALLLFLKTYYIEGATLYLESVYEDLKKSAVILGKTSVIKEHFKKGITGTKAMVYKLNLPKTSAVFEALNRNQIFSGVKNNG
ncbi:hypothetical protein [Desulfurobacterium sp.]